MIGHEGTTIDVAGCSIVDEDGSSTLRGGEFSSKWGPGISSMFRANGEVHLPPVTKLIFEEVAQERCGSGAEAVRKRCGSGAEAVRNGAERCGTVQKRCS
jgi:hypothetical protein